MTVTLTTVLNLIMRQDTDTGAHRSHCLSGSPRCSHRLGDQRGIEKQWRFFHSDAPLKKARWSGVCVMARLTDCIVWVRVRVGVGVRVRVRARVRARIVVGVMIIHGHNCNSGRRLDTGTDPIIQQAANTPYA